MPKVRLRRTQGGAKKKVAKKVAKKVSKGPKKRGKPPKPNMTRLERDAKDAVDEYEQERTILSTMRSEFEENFPDARSALRDIREQEDLVGQTIVAAKAKVGLAKVDVGEFTCQRTFAQPGYDDKKLTEILKNLEDVGDLLQHLLEEGVIKEFKVDKAASAAFAATNPTTAEDLSDAWKDKVELTTRVTVPKL